MFYFQEKHECDFLVKTPVAVEQAIQVCYELTPENEARELSGLLEAMQACRLSEGLILTYDQEGNEHKDNRQIRILPVWKWLLEDTHDQDQPTSQK